MRHKFKPDRDADPFAIRAIDVAPTGADLLVGRHSSTGAFRLAIASADSLAWKEDLSWALEGAAVYARFFHHSDKVLFQDERGAVSVLSRQSRQVRPIQPGPVDYVAVSMMRQMAALCGRTIDIVGLSEPVEHKWRLDKLQGIAAINPSESQIGIAGPSIEGIQLYDVSTQAISGSLGKTVTGAHALEYDPSGGYLALIGGGMRGCTIWNLATGRTVGESFCNSTRNNCYCLEFHPRLTTIAFGTFAGYVVVVDLAEDELLYMEKLHEGQIWDIAFSRDGSYLFTAGDDGVLNRIEWDEMMSLGTSRVG